MDYDAYKRARDMSWKVLLKFKVSSLPVQVSAICKAAGISLHKYSDSGALFALFKVHNHARINDGFMICGVGPPKIFYDDAVKSVARRRFTVAHELGHFFLQHAGQPLGDIIVTQRNRQPTNDDTGIEAEANVFARGLLAPACVLRAAGANSAEAISKLCGISMEAARYRAQRMELLIERNQFLISPLERSVYEQFQHFINLHRILELC